MTAPIRPDAALTTRTANDLRVLAEDRHTYFRGLVISATYTAIAGHEQGNEQMLRTGLIQLASFTAASVAVEAGRP